MSGGAATPPKGLARCNPPIVTASILASSCTTVARFHDCNVLPRWRAEGGGKALLGNHSCSTRATQERLSTARRPQPELGGASTAGDEAADASVALTSLYRAAKAGGAAGVRAALAAGANPNAPVLDPQWGFESAALQAAACFGNSWCSCMWPRCSRGGFACGSGGAAAVDSALHSQCKQAHCNQRGTIEIARPRLQCHATGCVALPPPPPASLCRWAPIIARHLSPG